jgi:PAS domain S-box-containing protein
MAEKILYKKIFIWLCVGLASVIWIIIAPDYLGNTFRHFIMELGGAFIAISTALVAFNCSFGKRYSILPYIGAAFLAAGLTDLLHALFAMEILIAPKAAMVRFIPGSWTAGRTALGLLLLLGLAHTTRKPDKKIPINQIAILTMLVTGSMLLLFAIFPLPAFIITDVRLFHRPWEYLAMLLYIGCLIAILKNQRDENADIMILLIPFLMLSIFTQLLMGLSFNLYERLFDTSHILRNVSYLAALIPLMIIVKRMSRHSLLIYSARMVTIMIIFLVAFSMFSLVSLANHRESRNAIFKINVDKETLTQFKSYIFQVADNVHDYQILSDIKNKERYYSFWDKIETLIKKQDFQSIIATDYEKTKDLLYDYNALISKIFEIEEVQGSLEAAQLHIESEEIIFRTIHPIINKIITKKNAEAIKEEESLVRQIKFILMGPLVILLVTIPFIFLLAMNQLRKQLEPVIALTDTAEKVSSGEFNLRTEVTSKNEIGQLGSYFNKMLNVINENEARTRKILEGVPVGIMLIDPNKKTVIEANLIAETMTGVPKEQLIRSEVSKYFSSKDTLLHLTDLKKNTVSFEDRLKTESGGEIPVLRTETEIELSGKTYYLECFIDITERKRAENILKNAHEELEEKVKGRTLELTEAKKTLETLNFDLEKRYKELTGLFTLGRLTEKSDNLEELATRFLKEVVPPSMQFPKKAIARIRLDDKEYVSSAGTFAVELTSPINIMGKKSGKLTVGYTEDLPFIPLHEQNLVNGYAERLEAFIEKKIIEDALKESEEKFRSLVVNAPDTIMTVDREGKILFINNPPPGITAEETIGTSLYDYIPLKYKKLVKQLIRRVFKTAKTDNYEIMARGGPYDSISWYATLVGPILNGNEVMKVILITRDITERKEMEEEFRLQSQIILNMNEGVYLIRISDGIIVYANPEFEKMFGYEQGEMIGQHFSIVNVPTDRDPKETVRLIMNILEETGEWHGEIENIKKDGTTFWCYANVLLFDYPIFGKVILAVHTDITERKKYELELKKAKESAESSNRAKSMFLANMSHEIRTPMTSILGFSDVLHGIIEDEQQKRFLSIISSSGNSLLSLINDILDISKIEADKLQLVYKPESPRLILSVIEQMFSQKVADKKLGFMVEIDDSMPEYLLLDGKRLRQILLNMVGNAVKFTHNGFIRISLDRLKPSKKKDSLDIVISVEDTGIGIPKENLETIFEVFNQQNPLVTDTYGGTGLGLAISERLVEAMGGEITVESEVGVGSKFSVILRDIKVESGFEEPKAADVIDIDNIRFKKSTILIADDVITNRRLIEEILKKYDINTIEAVNGQEAIDLARLYHPDMILLDLRLPVMDGYKALGIIKSEEELENIPVIIITASVMKEIENMVREKHCDGFITKPIDKRILITELMRFLTIDDSKPSIIKPSKYEEEGVIPKELVTPALLGRLPEVLGILQGDMSERLNRLKKSMIINEMEEYAEDIIDLAQKNDLEDLKKWGNELLLQANNFNIDQVKSTMKKFKQKVLQIEKLADKKIQD